MNKRAPTQGPKFKFIVNRRQNDKSSIQQVARQNAFFEKLFRVLSFKKPSMVFLIRPSVGFL